MGRTRIIVRPHSEGAEARKRDVRHGDAVAEQELVLRLLKVSVQLVVQTLWRVVMTQRIRENGGRESYLDGIKTALC